ncbi:MAG: carboxypeptidase-like regulatory domain-containing protein [Bacteroidota bacterium]|jgi:outer membrane receptor for ferrienterochelin and colicins
MNAKVIVWGFLCLVFSISVVSSQTLDGKVYEISEKKDTLPLTGAVLRWLGSSVGTVTDKNGEFKIKRISENLNLVVSFTGYKPDTVLIDSSRNFVLIYLSNVNMLQQVDVVYSAKGSEYSFMNTMKVEVLSQRELTKAACCNLSESFETNASVDVNFSDAVTGTKQIQMLGLSGQYALITKENMPYLRGLAGIYGLTFIPGTWINSIQLSKGAGSVINGYESFTGQINTELHQAENSEKLFFNAYGNANARNEYNLNLTRKLNETWDAVLLGHFSLNPLKQDMNGDGFIDIPTGRQYNVMNRFSYMTRKRFEGQIGFGYVNDTREGGQIEYDHSKGPEQQNFYGIGIQSEKFDVFTKNGYVFKKPETSMGLQLSYLQHKQSNFYGLNNYEGLQQTFYANFIFQGIISNTNHKYKLGMSFMNDVLKEKYKLYQFNRNEVVPGTFLEYTYSYLTKFSCVAGVRADYHNYFGLFFTPRLHIRYALNDNKTVFRASAGRALKTANVFAENSSFMATSREFFVNATDVNLPYGLKPEIAWNYGVNFMQKFKLNYREAQFIVDLYRTDFQQQVVVDIDYNPQQVLIYNLNGKSYSQTAQVEFRWEIRKRLDMVLAYRYIDTKTQFVSGLLPKYLLGKHRAFINLSYETKNDHWQMDFTTAWNGKKRMPLTLLNPQEYRIAEFSPDFFNIHGQVTYKTGFKRKFEIYLGVENLLNVQQRDAIVGRDNPFGKYFDASMVWGSVYGRMMYGGIRYKIK